MNRKSSEIQLTGIRVVVSGPEGPPGRSAASTVGNEHQDREQCDNLEPRSGQQHPPVESLHHENLEGESADATAESCRFRSRAISFAHENDFSLFYRNHARATRDYLVARNTCLLVGIAGEIVLRTGAVSECVNSTAKLTIESLFGHRRRRVRNKRTRRVSLRYACDFRITPIANFRKRVHRQL